MASYEVNERGGRRTPAELIDARQYVLDSDWGDVQPDAEAQNAYLERHDWDEYAEWHLGLTEGATDETKARYAFVYGDLRRVHRTGADRLRLPGVGVAAQGRSSSPPTTCCSTSTSPRRRDGRPLTHGGLRPAGMRSSRSEAERQRRRSARRPGHRTRGPLVGKDRGVTYDDIVSIFMATPETPFPQPTAPDVAGPPAARRARADRHPGLVGARRRASASPRSASASSTATCGVGPASLGTPTRGRRGGHVRRVRPGHAHAPSTSGPSPWRRVTTCSRPGRQARPRRSARSSSADEAERHRRSAARRARPRRRPGPAAVQRAARPAPPDVGPAAGCGAPPSWCASTAATATSRRSSRRHRPAGRSTC